MLQMSTRQALQVEGNVEARSCNHCCSGKAVLFCVCVCVCVCVFVVLGIQREMRLPGSTIFSTLSHKRHDFRKKKLLNIKLCFDFLYDFFLKRFSF